MLMTRHRVILETVVFSPGITADKANKQQSNIILKYIYQLLIKIYHFIFHFLSNKGSWIKEIV